MRQLLAGAEPDSQSKVGEKDRLLHNRVEMYLRNAPELFRQTIGCQCREGVVILRGHVDSYYQKQLAQEISRRIDGVKIIINRLVVDRSELTRLLNEMVPVNPQGCQPAGRVESTISD